MFSTESEYYNPILNIYDIIFLFVAELEEPKIIMCGKGLTKQILPEPPVAQFVAYRTSEQGLSGSNLDLTNFCPHRDDSHCVVNFCHH